MVSIHCPLCCDEPFEDQQSLFFHLRGLRNNLFCPICSEKFSALELLVTHLSRKCNGPASPSEAKRRCLSSVSLSDVEDDCSKKENQVIANKSSSCVPLQIPESILKNLSISIKEPVEKSSQKQIPSGSQVRPIMVAVDPKDAITNGFPSHPLALKSHGDIKEIKVLKSSPLKVNSNANLLASHGTIPKRVNDLKNADLTVTPKSSACTSTVSSAYLLIPNNVSKEVIPITTPTSANPAQAASQPLTLKSHGDIKETKGLGSPPLKVNSNANLLASHRTIPKCVNELKNADLTVTPKSSACTSTGSLADLLTPSKVSKEVIPITTPTSANTLQEASQSTTSVKRKRGRPKKNADVISNGALNSSIGETPSNDSNDASKGVENLLEKSLEGLGIESEVINCDLSKGSEQNAVENTSNDASKTVVQEEYNCSGCNVRFTSIYEHIKDFHDQEKVVVEVPEEEIQKDLIAFQQLVSNNVDPGKKTPSAPDAEATAVTQPVIERGDVEDLPPPVAAPQHIVPPKRVKKNFYFLKQIKKLKQSGSGDWLRSKNSKRTYYHFVTNKKKMLRLACELKLNLKTHPTFKMPIKDLFENPKINIIAITNKPKTQVYTYKEVDLNKPIPMYVVARRVEKEEEEMLGGIASFVLANPQGTNCTSLSRDDKVIAVMKVILASDQCLTVENMVFKSKPAVESMVPVLEDVLDPPVPLLKGGKMLKWKCVKCMNITWKFPLNKDSHMCNGCYICHKPFATSVSLRKHMYIHKKNITNYCEKCHLAFVSSKVLENHLSEHEDHNICSICNLFVPIHQESAHKALHARLPVDQFPCSVCHQVFGSKEEVKTHETKSCGRLIARYSCSLCDKKFFSLTALSFHTRDHKDVTIKFPCRFCPKTFIKEKEQCPRKAGKRKPLSYLQKIWHERIHTRDRPILCSACPKRFRSLDHRLVHSNQAHKPSTHRDIPIHMCSVCDKLFPSVHKLEEHKKDHAMT